MGNFIVIILDGVGIGELPDAAIYGDKGANTLVNLSEKMGGLSLPNLEKMGLGNITDIKGIKKVSNPLSSYGKMNEISPGKDSTTGHWEIGGLKVDFEFPYYPDGFSEELINKFLAETGIEAVLGNKPASGTEIIKELGDEHCKTGFPIVYTSADSVFQIAAHEKIIPLEELFRICTIAREKVFTGKDTVGRIIARPFVGKSGSYTRTTNRKDFSISPTSKTIIDYASDNGVDTYGIGKINDLFNYQGIKYQVKSKSNAEGISKTIETIKSAKNSFIFTNLVDFDVYYGHRLDPEGFYKALIEFDNALPSIIESMDNSDMLILTADHGNDPTTKSTDHSREFVPLLFYSAKRRGVDLGTRETFADVAQTIAEYFKINNDLTGISFLKV